MYLSQVINAESAVLVLKLTDSVLFSDAARKLLIAENEEEQLHTNLGATIDGGQQLVLIPPPWQQLQGLSDHAWCQFIRECASTPYVGMTRMPHRLNAKHRQPYLLPRMTNDHQTSLKISCPEVTWCVQV